MAEYRRRSCTGKYAWDDPYAALREMFALPYRNPDIDEYNISLYRCRFCDYWHLGTTVPGWLKGAPIKYEMPGQAMMHFPELDDYSPNGHRVKRRDGGMVEPLESERA